MSAVTEAAVFDALRTVQEPELGGDLVTRNMIRDLVLTGSDVAFTIELTTPACPLKDQIEGEVRKALTPVGIEGIEITWGATVRRATPRVAEQLVPGVKNVIAVASGKGGVGKSTVSVNLAVSLAKSGATVGLLDADITGPNIPMMLGLDGQPTASPDNKIIPLERHGVKAISIQFFVPEGQPSVWRGPLIGGARRGASDGRAPCDLDPLDAHRGEGLADLGLDLVLERAGRGGELDRERDVGAGEDQVLDHVAGDEVATQLGLLDGTEGVEDGSLGDSAHQGRFAPVRRAAGRISDARGVDIVPVAGRQRDWAFRGCGGWRRPSRRSETRRAKSAPVPHRSCEIRNESAPNRPNSCI